MGRARNFLVSCLRQRDWFGIGIGGLFIVVAAAGASILFSQAMAEAALKRFHLASDSFPVWSAHQMVPAMYNFENRVKISSTIDPQGNFDPDDKTFSEDIINHFPARIITFGDQRHRFAKGQEGMFEMSSVFGVTKLVSRWNLKRDEANRILVERVFQKFEYSSDENRSEPDGQ